MLVESLLVTFSLLLLLVYMVKLYLYRNDGFWPKLGVPFLDLDTVVGFWDRTTMKVSFVELINRMYDHHCDLPYYGFTMFGTPMLFVRDLDMLKNFMVKDFDYFSERNTIGDNRKNDPQFSRMLLNVRGKEWKDLRSIMSPTFTTGKIREMVPLINNCASHMVNHLKGLEANGTNDTNFLDIFNSFTIDTIASIAFGMETDVFQGDSLIRKMALKFQELTPFRLFKMMMLTHLPKVAATFNLAFSEPVSTQFFTKVILQNIEMRKREKVKRQDFLQLMIEAREGQLKDDGDGGEGEEGKFKSGEAENVLDEMTMVSQCLLFFAAGFDTTSTVLTFAVYNLALNPDVQQKLSKEVTKVMDENGGILTYEAIARLEYVEMVISESMRLYTPLFAVDRTCVKDYLIPGTKIVMPKGSRILSPIVGIHMDPKYYPDSHKFNPEHFSAENKNKRHPYTFMPFGQGPRSCIAMRFAMIEAKAAMIHLIYNFKIEPCQKTETPVTMNKNSIILKPKNGMMLKFSSRR